MLKVHIDADGCPVVLSTINIARNSQITPIIYCDTSHEIRVEGVETKIVSKGMDAVDFAILNVVLKCDIVVTQDYGLAAMVLAKGAYCIDQNGREFTNENIDQLLFTRHVGQKIRQAGGRTKGPKKRQKDANEIYEKKFKQLCERAKIDAEKA
ncbi:YaiI/YqxD family protein [Kurthia gibsonii]|uniref:YaiI/YqxD family protein n=1 Tax=Kurthia gibsonii TaxID=33946 RepID=UPI002DC03202|nr:YaiI/YqxD family protein [Kurthia gibsonii]MEB7773430.1 YaiI/YqxD family protein [Kurthia gibsonii]